MASEVVDECVSKAKEGSIEAAAAHDSLDGDKLSEGSPDEVPSVGSRLHGSGECKPCAWFWKPQGCQNARECMHCHLCPRNSIKDRKKLHATARKELAQVPQQVELSGIMEAVGEEVKAAANPVLLGADVKEIEPGKPSKGSALHGTGECKPCAWFWHPKGCQNAEDCEFCHFCPEGELKLRRKLKIQNLRGGAGDESSSSPKYVTLQAAKEHSEGTSITTTPSDTSTKVLSDARPEAQAAISVGSASHDTGECKPCAWFWKPGSCANGKECLHCHLCPEGELRRKKKEKTSMASGKKKTNGPASLSVRQQLAFQNQVIHQQQESLAHLQGQMFMQQQMMWAAAMGYPPTDMNMRQLYTDHDDEDEEEESSEVAS